MTWPCGIRMPRGTSTSLVSSLSMAMTEVSSPLWVYLSPIRSIMPWTLPSSPGVPWSALKTTSGSSSASRSATSRPISSSVTRLQPLPRSASATPRPPSRPSARQHEGRGSIEAPDPLDFPLEQDVGFFHHPAPHFLAQFLDLGACRVAEVQEEIAMLFRDLRVAEPESAA